MGAVSSVVDTVSDVASGVGDIASGAIEGVSQLRSEEHTSELQSH